MRILCFILVLFLTACHTPTSIQKDSVRPRPGKQARVLDGAPKRPAPVFFQKVKPIHEPYSRYGNPDSYRVEGRNYQVLRSAHGYKERGIASWYGTGFHSKRTSSGDKYDMYAMTAAHKTLPLPSYVRVKNLDNGRVVIVRVNDRGPFRRDRILDLSYAAATRLGLLPKGTARVEVQALVPKGTPKARYFVQAGAFTSQIMANNLSKQVKKISSAPVKIEKYRRRYLVKTGPFSDKNRSDRVQRQLRNQGMRGAFTLLQ